MGHRDIADENRNHGDIQIQGRGNLDPHQVFGVFQSPLALLRAVRISGIQPTVPNDRQEHVALADSLAEPLREVGSRRNAFHVDENRLLAEPLLQLLVELLGHESTVVAAVRNEDLGHRCAGSGETPMSHDTASILTVRKRGRQAVTPP